MTTIQHFDKDALIAAMSGDKVEYKEFLRAPSTHCGIYRLVAGEEDPQQPHSEDEVYYALSGRALFETEEGTTEVTEGSILFVKANAKHRFVEIIEDLTLLVLFVSNPGDN